MQACHVYRLVTPPGMRFFVFKILRTKSPQNIESKRVARKIFKNKDLITTEAQRHRDQGRNTPAGRRVRSSTDEPISKNRTS
jgi:hypothetical protein